MCSDTWRYVPKPFFISLRFVILIGVCFLIALILICIFLIDDAEHFPEVLAFCMSSWGKVLRGVLSCREYMFGCSGVLNTCWVVLSQLYFGGPHASVFSTFTSDVQSTCARLMDWHLCLTVLGLGVMRFQELNSRPCEC